MNKDQEKLSDQRLCINGPSYLSWQSHGLTCIINRDAIFSHLCGYVILPDDHPFDGKPAHEINRKFPSVYGGITWSDTVKKIGITAFHIHESQEERWAIGDDCGRAYDFCHVKNEVENLVKFVIEASRNSSLGEFSMELGNISYKLDNINANLAHLIGLIQGGMSTIEEKELWRNQQEINKKIYDELAKLIIHQQEANKKIHDCWINMPPLS